MAISFVRLNDSGGGNTATQSAALTGSVAIGDLLIGMISYGGAPTNHTGLTLTDNLNAGAWNIPPALHYFPGSGNGCDIQVGWIRCDTAGAGVTITGGNLGTSDFSIVTAAQYTGFVNSPALVTADVTTNFGTGTTLAATGLTNSFANELMLMFGTAGGGQGVTSVTGGFNQRETQGSDLYGDRVFATSGNAVTWGATITSNAWAVMLAGFQDAVTAVLQESSLSSMSLGPG